MKDEFDDMSFLNDDELAEAEANALKKAEGGGEIVETSDECEGGACKI